MLNKLLRTAVRDEGSLLLSPPLQSASTSCAEVEAFSPRTESEVMEMKQMGTKPPDSEPLEPEKESSHGVLPTTIAGFGVGKPVGVLAVFTFVALVTVLSGAHRSLPLDSLLSRRSAAPAGAQLPASSSTCNPAANSSTATTSNSSTATPSHSSTAEPPEDRLLGGLLSSSFYEASCQSRSEVSQLWKPSNLHTPSPFLLQKLRSYEALHKRCAPYTELYNKSIEQLKSNRSEGPMECNYVVWMASDGLGNRMISLTSAFLYTLLSNKVLLLDLPEDMKGLFCEPFPDTTWVLPSADFPIRNLKWVWHFDKDPRRYGDMLKKKLLSNDMNTANASLPAYLYLHLIHANDDFDKMFYCGDSQPLLRNFPWLLLRSNQYFVPALFLIPEFEKELTLLFPERTTVFHLLGRYLFHPSNSVWGYITRYYEAYLANAKERLGMQIRVLGKVDFDKHSSQIIECALSNKLLPDVVHNDLGLSNVTEVKPKAVIVASLNSGYFERLRDMYYEHATTTGEVIGVYQPSHEEQQHTEKLSHNMKALAEIYLLSFSDALITSRYSTFGYMAQGLGGLRPWLLVGTPDRKNVCLHSLTMEPCFHFPPSYDCKARRKADLGSMAPYLAHCEDFPNGIKLFY